MLEIIYSMATSFISLIIYKNLNKNEKKSTTEIISYYFLTMITNYFIMSAILYFVFNIEVVKYSLLFAQKYIFLSSFIAINLPFIFNKTKKYAIKIVEKYFGFLDSVFNSQVVKKTKKVVNKVLKTINKIYKKNKEEIDSDIKFIIFIIIQLLFYDFIIRNIVYQEIGFYQTYKLTPNLLTVAYGFLIGTLLVLLPRILTKITYVIVSVLSFVLFIVNYILIAIKSEAFSVYNLQIAQEGIEFVSFVIDLINVKLIIILLIVVIINILIFKSIKNIKSTLKISKKVFVIIISIIIFTALRYISIAILEDYRTKDGWQDITYPKYYTEKMINSKKNISVLGLYEYTYRDIKNYYKSSNEKIGSKDEIETIINNSTKEKENKKTNKFKNKNLIMIMMESIDNIVVNEEIMPTLTMMRNEGWNFDKRYSQLNSGGSTIATEFATLSGLFYSYDNRYDVNSYKEAIPSMFKKNNYIVSSFHENHGVYYNRNQLHKSLGFENSYFLLDMNLNEYNYYDDSQFFQNDELYDLVVPKDLNKPFMSFITTIAAHGPYNNVNNGICMQEKTKNEKECLEYLSSRTDDMLKIMLERLKEDNLLEDTVIVLYSDHAAYSYSYTEDELKNTYEKINGEYTTKNLPFIIYNSELKSKDYEELIVNDVDFAPTIFNLFGIEYDSRYYVGTDIFSENHKNVSIFQDYTWYDGKIHSTTSEKNKYFKETSKYVQEKLDFSKMLISNDYYKNMK